MTFLQPALLLGLPLAALPIVIHLIHLYRRRQVKWAAMMFLYAAQRMNKGLSRLRQILILALRALAVAAIILAITRPLAGGWLGLTGGAPDTVLVMLDRSASMSQGTLATGVSKRLAGLRQLTQAIRDAVGTRSHLVLLESALGHPLALEKPEALLDLPQTGPTETAADLPALLQGALDYITANRTGRTEVWMLSDLRRADWDAESGRWPTLRTAFGTLQGVRFHLLCYPEEAPEDLDVRVERVTRRETAEKAELLLDLRITRQAAHPQPQELPLRLVVNGEATTATVTLRENQLVLQSYRLPLDKTVKRGWGRVELPADANPANNTSYFVFDEPAPLRSVIVTENEAEAGPLRAVLSAALDPTRRYEATVLAPRQAAEIPWDTTALLVWQAPLPPPEDILARQMQAHVTAGRSLLFLPPEVPAPTELFGLHWAGWEGSAGEKSPAVEGWRNDTGLLANTRNGTALPVGALEVARQCRIDGEGVPLARMAGRGPLLVRSAQTSGGSVYFLGTLAGPGSSSLARDGVVLFAMLHRALEEGAPTLGKAQGRVASASALGADPTVWQAANPKAEAIVSTELPLRAGVLAAGDRLLALNRPPTEDRLETLSTAALSELFAGLDFQVLTGQLEGGQSLTSEVWRTFLFAMAAALLAEALLCLPPRRESPAAEFRSSAAQPKIA